MATERRIVDFGAGDAPWSSINDVVMGGHSFGEMIVEDGVGVFRGEVSLEDGGGFASVRSRPRDYDLSGVDKLTLRIRGDGKHYSLRLRTTEAFDGVSYESTFETSGEWESLEVSLSELVPVFRGDELADHPPLDSSNVRTFGLMIKDRQKGPFRLEIAWIGVE